MIFKSRFPLEIGRHVVGWVAVKMRRLMSRCWWRPIKCRTNESVNVMRLNTRRVAQIDCAMSVFLNAGRQNVAYFGGFASAGAADAAEARCLIWPSLYGSPFFIHLTAIAIICAGTNFTSNAVGAQLHSAQYDREIRRAVEVYWPDYPVWRQWKAQLIAESNLNPAAVSPVGARGLAQFMPRTFAEVTRAMRIGAVSPHDAGIAIQAGAYYMQTLRRQWRAPRPVEDQQKLAQASYNAGVGNIVAAQRECGGALYDEIVECLSMITGRHSAETIGYVRRIWKIWRDLEAAR